MRLKLMKIYVLRCIVIRVSEFLVLIYRFLLSFRLKYHVVGNQTWGRILTSRRLLTDVGFEYTFLPSRFPHVFYYHLINSGLILGIS